MKWLMWLGRGAILCVSVCALIFICGIVYKLIRRSKLQKLMLTDRTKSGFIGRLLRTACPDMPYLRNMYFPASASGGQYVKIPLVTVGQGGVCLIFTFSHAGKIDNPFHGDWISYWEDGSAHVFPNPIDESRKYVRVIERIFQTEKVENVPLHQAFVFTGTGVRFRHRMENLTTVDKLPDWLHDLNKNRFLSAKEIRKTEELLERYAHRSPSLPSVAEIKKSKKRAAPPEMSAEQESETDAGKAGEGNAR